MDRTDERPVILHRGVFKRTASTAEAVFMITGMTIGAGVFGLPYVVARLGLVPGGLYIILLGAVMLALNLLIGDVVARTDEPLQIPGLARKYLGTAAGRVLAFAFLASGLGALLAYVIGGGVVIGSVFNGPARVGSVLFWLVGSGIVVSGFNSVKRFETAVSALVIALLFLISGSIIFRSPQPFAWSVVHWPSIWLPFGVILFALHGAPAIAEAEAVLPNNPSAFKRALIWGTLIPVAIYVLFAVFVAGATGNATTEVATVGLSRVFGGLMGHLGNAVAILAMGTAYVGLANALRDGLAWDYKIRRGYATALALGLPLLLYFLGAHSFIAVLEVVGGVLLGMEAVGMCLVYRAASRNLPRGAASGVKAGFSLRHGAIILAFVLAFFSLFTFVNVVRIIW